MFRAAIYQLRTGFLGSLLLAGFLLIGWNLGEAFGFGIAAAVLLGITLLIYFRADARVLRMHRARRIDPAQAPGLYGLVRELSRRAGVPVPAVYVIREPAANAFAIGRTARHGGIVVSTGLLDVLDRDELAAVIAHEVGHLRRGDTRLMTLLAAVASAGPLPSDRFAWLLAPFTALLIRAGVSGDREYCADEDSARLIGDPSPLARALMKIEAGNSQRPLHTASPATAHLFICNPLCLKGSARLFQTHPAVTNRVERLDALARRPVVPPGLARAQ